MVILGEMETLVGLRHGKCISKGKIREVNGIEEDRKSVGVEI